LSARVSGYVRFVALACATSICPLVANAADDAHYRLPPRAILDVLNSTPLPVPFVAPNREWLLLATPLRYPPIADLARPMLRLAGMRIDPANNGIHHASSFTAYALVRISDGKRSDVKLPAGAHAGVPVWSPDGMRFAFSNATARSIDLYVGSVATGDVRKVPNTHLNTLFGNMIAWTPDGKLILAYLVPFRRLPAPGAIWTASGPIVDETTGTKAPAVTFEDLLQSAHDADVWEYYAQGQYAFVDPATGTPSVLTTLPDIIRSARISPDGLHVVLDRIRRPYSYAVPWEAFGRRLTEIDLGKTWKGRTLADIPLQTNGSFDAVSTGPRDVAWRPDVAATLLWSETQDGGDPGKVTAVRDIVYQYDVVRDTKPRAVLTLPDRFEGFDFVDRSSVAFVRAYDRATRLTRTLQIDLASGGAAYELSKLRDGDRYHDPGRPMTRLAPNGQQVAQRDGDSIFLRGVGAGPDGRKPFVDRLDLNTHAKTRLFQSDLLPLEEPLALLTTNGRSLLVTRQSPSEPPNDVVVSDAAGSKSERALTKFSDPTPQLRGIQRRLVSYKRPDGVDLSFTLYLPPGYKEGTRLPTFVWAYPAEFNDPSIAGQNTNSAQTFVTIGGASQVFMVLGGYAVLDNAAVPIVGDPKTVNDTFVEQLTADMQAAIDKAVALGVTDPDRVAVGGHSYGAFMTANLLAHTRLFRAGIARSGAYNRSLTPFGFQSERRTYWEATDLYTKLSPFTYADKIVDPLLLIHGVADDNTGTFPIQSERMFAAIKGNGGTARLVLLPYEAHGYLARESIQTTLAEMLDWLDRYVKNAPPRSAAQPTK
jgi:dipeptidyl aminopeptidase/acylaminoacyl peptidase